MSAAISAKSWSSLRHRKLARAELDMLMKELAASGTTIEHHPALDTAPVHSPAMRRFLGD